MTMTTLEAIQKMRNAADEAERRVAAGHDNQARELIAATIETMSADFKVDPDASNPETQPETDDAGEPT